MLLIQCMQSIRYICGISFERVQEREDEVACRVGMMMIDDRRGRISRDRGDATSHDRRQVVLSTLAVNWRSFLVVYSRR